MTSFANKKELKFVITLGTGSFGSSSNNQITLQGFRAAADIDATAAAYNGTSPSTLNITTVSSNDLIMFWGQAFHGSSTISPTGMVNALYTTGGSEPMYIGAKFAFNPGSYLLNLIVGTADNFPFVAIAIK